MAERPRAVTFTTDAEAIPILSVDTSLANNHNHNNNNDNYHHHHSTDILTPLPTSPRRWWNPSPLLPSAEIRRRHTITPRVRPRPRSFRRRSSSLRSIFSWTSSKSGSTLKPSNQYRQSRFIEHLKRSDWGFTEEDTYLAVPPPAGAIIEESSSEDISGSEKKEVSRKGKEKEWPLNRKAEKVLKQNSPVDSHHSKGSCREGERETIRAVTPEGLPFRVTVSSSAPRDHPCLRSVRLGGRRGCDTVGGEGEEQLLIPKRERRKNRERVMTWMGNQFHRFSDRSNSCSSAEKTSQ